MFGGGLFSSCWFLFITGQASKILCIAQKGERASLVIFFNRKTEAEEEAAGAGAEVAGKCNGATT